MNISLPSPLKTFVERKVRAGSYGSASEYVRDLIRDDQRKEAADKLRSLIAESLASGAPLPVNASYWTAKRKQLGG